MSKIKQEIQILQSEGLWVSGIISNFNTKETYNSTTKRALFHALYYGPVRNQSINTINPEQETLE